MNTRGVRTLASTFAAAFLCATFAWISMAAAGHFDDGVAAYHKGEYAKAIQLFEAGYAKGKDPVYLFNIAKCHEKAAHYQKAIDYYQNYLKGKPNANDRKDVEQTVIALKQKIEAARPSLEVHSAPPGAELLLNGKFVGTTPMKLKVDPGKWNVKFSLDGRIPAEKNITITQGKNARIAVRLKPVPQVGTLHVTSNIVGAEVRIDGKLVGKTPLPPLPGVRLGSHQILVEKKGHLSWIGSGEVKRGSTTTVQSKLVLAEVGISKKAILGFTALGVAAVAESLAWVFYAQGQDKFADEDGISSDRNASIGFHVTAGVTAAAAAGLITWWLLDRKDSAKGAVSQTVAPGLVRW